MTIETKFNIGEEIFFMKDNRVVSGIISSIFVKAKGDITKSKENVSVEIKYGLYVGSLATDGADFFEHNIYPSKKELLNSL